MREREGDRVLFYLLSLSKWSQQLELDQTKARSPTWGGKGLKHLSHLPLLFQVHYRGSGSEVDLPRTQNQCPCGMPVTPQCRTAHWDFNIVTHSKKYGKRCVLGKCLKILKCSSQIGFEFHIHQLA